MAQPQHPYRNPAVERLVNALGLDIKVVRSLKIIIPDDDAITAEIELLPTMDHLNAVADFVAECPPVIVYDSPPV